MFRGGGQLVQSPIIDQYFPDTSRLENDPAKGAGYFSSDTGIEVVQTLLETNMLSRLLSR
jgi:hypothetical protein